MGSPGDQLLKACRNARDEVVLVAPFIKSNVLEYLLSAIPNEKISIKCVARWHPEEIAAGVCDVEIFDVLQNRPHAHLFIHPLLHAKYFRVDGRYLIGSANLTRSALGWRTPSNLELLLEVPAENQDLQTFEQNLWASAFRASRELRDEMAAAASSLREYGTKFDSVTEEPGLESSGFESIDPSWLPVCPQPRDLHKIYLDEDVEDVLIGVRRAGREDLKRLQIPPGLSEDSFKKFVAVSIKQSSLVKRVYEESAKGELTPQDGTDLINSEFHTQSYSGYEAKNLWDVARNWIVYFVSQDFRQPPNTNNLQQGKAIGAL